MARRRRGPMVEGALRPRSPQSGHGRRGVNAAWRRGRSGAGEPALALTCGHERVYETRGLTGTPTWTSLLLRCGRTNTEASGWAAPTRPWRGRWRTRRRGPRHKALCPGGHWSPVRPYVVDPTGTACQSNVEYGRYVNWHVEDDPQPFLTTPGNRARRRRGARSCAPPWR